MQIIPWPAHTYVTRSRVVVVVIVAVVGAARGACPLRLVATLLVVVAATAIVVVVAEQRQATLLEQPIEVAGRVLEHIARLVHQHADGEVDQQIVQLRWCLELTHLGGASAGGQVWDNNTSMTLVKSVIDMEGGDGHTMAQCLTAGGGREERSETDTYEDESSN